MGSVCGGSGATFGYWRNDEGTGWILFSPGPDGVYDIVPWEDYDPANHPTPALIEKSYDPTNGTYTRGDLWRVKN